MQALYVSRGPRSPSPKRGRSPPQFSAHVSCGQTAGWMKLVLAWRYFYCGQTAGCIKMSLGMEVGLSPRDFVFDGDPAPSPKRGRSPSPIFVPCLLRPNGCMDQDATWYKDRPWRRRHCVRWGPSSALPQKGGRAPSPIFGPCLLWPNCWMDQGGTWHGGGPWSRPHCARWGHSSPQFLAHVYCGQTAGWI